MICLNEKTSAGAGQRIGFKLCSSINNCISENTLQTERQGHRLGMICHKPPARHIIMARTCCHLVPVILGELQNATNCVHINHRTETERRYSLGFCFKLVLQLKGNVPSCIRKVKAFFLQLDCITSAIKVSPLVHSQYDLCNLCKK